MATPAAAMSGAPRAMSSSTNPIDEEDAHHERRVRG